MVSEELWNTIQEIITRKQAVQLRDATTGKVQGRPETTRKGLLSGFARCQVCGGSRTHKKLPCDRDVYVCSRRNASCTAACGNGFFYATEPAHQTVIESRDLLLNADAIERARDLAVEQSDQTPGELEAGREEATAAIKKLETDITNLVTLAASSGSAALLDGIKSRERQKADL